LTEVSLQVFDKEDVVMRQIKMLKIEKKEIVNVSYLTAKPRSQDLASPPVIPI